MTEKQQIKRIPLSFKLTIDEKQKLEKCAASENRQMTSWLRNKILTCYNELIRQESKENESGV